MADERIVRALVRLHTEAEILVICGKAMAAYQALKNGAVTGQGMDGLSTNMALPHDPAELIDCCEAALARLDGDAEDATSVSMDFSNRITGT